MVQSLGVSYELVGARCTHADWGLVVKNLLKPRFANIEAYDTWSLYLFFGHLSEIQSLIAALKSCTPSV